ncbi:hypothetical protein M5K25_003110 [Dendrobium thyrsiflorum]|uniref:Uncharacterized protein n=1 Tax=Dendrobium thyrsiflorum TaxID=117978 RepID=A0ABD0VWX2_DENTH
MLACKLSLSVNFFPHSILIKSVSSPLISEIMRTIRAKRKKKWFEKAMDICHIAASIHIYIYIEMDRIGQSAWF